MNITTVIETHTRKTISRGIVLGDEIVYESPESIVCCEDNKEVNQITDTLGDLYIPGEDYVVGLSNGYPAVFLQDDNGRHDPMLQIIIEEFDI